MSNITKITLYNLQKHSLNEIYAGKHWRVRKKIKDKYIKVVKNQIKHTFSKDRVYDVTYEFVFQSRPIDVSNTVYMLKMIEDILFESDGYKIVTDLHIKSRKGKTDCVNITVKEL